MNSYDLHGKVAVITGGAQGIGLAVAQRLHASGATVLLWDRDGELAAASAAGFGGRAHGAAVDVTDAAAIHALADRAVADHGRIDILVASAGIAGSIDTVVN